MPFSRRFYPKRLTVMCAYILRMGDVDLGEGEMGEAGRVAVGGAGQLTRVGVARWKAWLAVEKCLLKFSIIVDLSAVTLFPSLSAVGSWEEVILVP